MERPLRGVVEAPPDDVLRNSHRRYDVTLTGRRSGILRDLDPVAVLNRIRLQAQIRILRISVADSNFTSNHFELM